MSIIRIFILLSFIIAINSISFSFSFGSGTGSFSNLFNFKDLTCNPYRVLSLPPWSSMKKIKRRYNELVKKYHPDKSETGSREEFELIQKSFEILKQKRKESEENEEDISFSFVIRSTIGDILNVEIIFGLIYIVAYAIYKFNILIYVPLFYMIISFTLIDNIFPHFFKETYIEYIVCLAVGWFLYSKHKQYFKDKNFKMNYFKYF